MWMAAVSADMDASPRLAGLLCAGHDIACSCCNLPEVGQPDGSSRMLLSKICRERSGLYKPPVLGGAALFGNSAPAVYKNPVP